MSERDRQDEFAEREADAAAAEVDRIAGRAPENEDPERWPVEEAGGGEAEGFEQSEELLEENAEHGELGGHDPLRDTFPAEDEPEGGGAEYGEADDSRTHDRPDEE
jgi:hypothetical protein